MEQIVNLFVCFLMISNLYQAYSYPTPSDILSGKEFLSILMDSDYRSGRSNNYASRSTTIQRSAVTAHPYRGSRKYSHVYYERAEEEESILPIEALFSSQDETSRSNSRSYDHRTRSRSRNGKLLSTTSSTTEAIATSKDLEVAASEISLSSSGTTEGEGVKSTMSTSEYSTDTVTTSGTTMTRFLMNVAIIQ